MSLLTVCTEQAGTQKSLPVSTDISANGTFSLYNYKISTFIPILFYQIPDDQTSCRPYFEKYKIFGVRLLHFSEEKRKNLIYG